MSDIRVRSFHDLTSLNNFLNLNKVEYVDVKYKCKYSKQERYDYEVYLLVYKKLA